MAKCVRTPDLPNQGLLQTALHQLFLKTKKERKEGQAYLNEAHTNATGSNISNWDQF